MLCVHTLLTNNKLEANHRITNGRTHHIRDIPQGGIPYDAIFQIYIISYKSLVNAIFENTPQPQVTRGSKLIILLAR